MRGLEPNDDGEPATGCVFELDRPAHCFDEAFGDRETEANAFAVARVAEPLKGEEHPVALVGLHAWAAVDDADVDPAVDGAGEDSRRLPLR